MNPLPYLDCYGQRGFWPIINLKCKLIYSSTNYPDPVLVHLLDVAVTTAVVNDPVPEADQEAHNDEEVHHGPEAGPNLDHLLPGDSQPRTG